MRQFLLVCLGGAAGSGARYLVQLGAARAFSASFAPTFPWGTFIVNLLGSMLLAALMHATASAKILSPNALLLLGTGVMGGFTTYSTFNWETSQYLSRGEWRTAALYAGATFILCLGGAAAGLAGARAIWPPPP